MKKICGKKLAFLLVACVLAAGTFVSCGDEETEEPTAADTLTKPTGTDPFTTGLYKAEVTPKDSDKDDDGKDPTYTYYYAIDTKGRVITAYENEGKTLDADTYQQKYTYDTSSKTITLAYYALSIPTDIDAYVSWMIADTEEEYTGKWKFGSKSDYINGYFKRTYDAYVAQLKERLAAAATEEKRKALQKELDDMQNQWNEVITNLNKLFDETVTYAYTKNGTVITLTNDAAEDKKLVLTPVSK